MHAFSQGAAFIYQTMTNIIFLGNFGHKVQSTLSWTVIHKKTKHIRYHRNSQSTNMSSLAKLLYFNFSECCILKLLPCVHDWPLHYKLETMTSQHSLTCKRVCSTTQLTVNITRMSEICYCVTYIFFLQCTNKLTISQSH